MTLNVIILRHGKTEGNIYHRYTGGRIDEPLCEEGLAELRAIAPDPGVDTVWVSPMLRARQTAEHLFPAARQIVVNELREMDFGDFEGRSAEDMADDPVYREWVNNSCEGGCPHGEKLGDFIERTRAVFLKLVDEALAAGRSRLTIVAHGGTLMAVMSAYSGDDRYLFYWNTENLRGWQMTLEEAEWREKKRFSGFAPYAPRSL
ncbi:MAG: histidine phosphatase family protein [Firmicutes bacterium]|nr:histidine phosphatase family protein [Bacillota bacterium]